MAKRVGLISINLVAGTAQFNTDMGKAKAQIKGVGDQATQSTEKMVSGFQATSASIRLMEGGLTNNLRAVERFVSTSLGLGPILQKMFPLVGGLAFLGLIYSMGTELYNFFKKAAEAPKVLTNAFRTLNEPLRITVDELRVANDHLDNDIAKLEGHRQNNLALALDEARLMADKLAESLDNDLQKLDEVFKNHSVNALSGFFTGRKGTGKDKDDVDAFVAEIAKTDAEGSRAVRSAKTQTEADKALDTWKKKAQDQIDAQVAIFRGRVAESERLQGGQEIRAIGLDGKLTTLKTAPRGPDRTEEIIERRGVVDNLNILGDRWQAQIDHFKKTKLHDFLLDESSNAKLDNPLLNMFRSLDEKLLASQTRLDAAGQTQSMKDMATATIEAVKALDELNKQRVALHEKPISEDSQIAAVIRLKSYDTARNNSEKEWQDQLAAGNSKLDERTQSYTDLASAVTLGYDAARRAHVEIARDELAKQHLGDPEWMKSGNHAAELADHDRRAAAEFDAQHSEGVATTVQALQNQITLETRLAKVQSEGADAIRMVTIAAKIENEQRVNGVEAARTLTRMLLQQYGAERLLAHSAELKKTNDQISDLEQLTAAELEGAEAARRMTLELKYQKMEEEGSSNENIEAERTLDRLKHQSELTVEVAKTANADRERLAVLFRELKQAELQKQSGVDQLGNLLQIRDIENEILTIRAKQLLLHGTALDGIKAFFTEMQKQAKQAGDIMKEALDKALDDVSNNLAALVTGAKTNWAQTFKDIGREMVTQTIKSGLQTGLGALGRKIFGPPKAVLSRKGQTPESSIYVTPIGGNPLAGMTPSLPPALNAGKGGGFVKGLGDFLKALGGSIFGAGGAGAGEGGGEAVTTSWTPLGNGGRMTADNAYLVGDEGPELLTGINATVMSNQKTRKLVGGGGDHYYQIDARGTDPVLTEQRTKAAIVAAHDAAIVTSVAANADSARRTPMRR